MAILTDMRSADMFAECPRRDAAAHNLALLTTGLLLLGNPYLQLKPLASIPAWQQIGEGEGVEKQGEEEQVARNVVIMEAAA